MGTNKEQTNKTNSEMKNQILLLLATLMVIVGKGQQTMHQTMPDIWLRADSCGNMLPTWVDYSGNGNNAVYSGQAPTIVDNFNFNPAFMLDGGGSFTLPYRPLQNSRSNFIAVYQAVDTTAELGVWAMVIDSTNSLKLTTMRVKNIKKYINYADTTWSYPVINSSMQGWRNQLVDTTVSKVVVGGTDSINLVGKLAEFLYYNHQLDDGMKAKVHTYLAIKYGITLHNMNYVASNDSVLWNFKQNEKYNNDVACIGCDTALGVDQRQSAGNGGNSSLVFANNALATSNASNANSIPNGNFIIWGSNGKQLQPIDSIVPGKVENLTGAAWKIQLMGYQSHSLTTTLVLMGNMIDSATYNLVIDQSPSGSFSVDSCSIFSPDSIDQDNNQYFNNISWDADGNGFDYFSFSIDTATTKQRLSGAHDPWAGTSTSGGGQQEKTQLQGSDEFMANTSLKAYPNPSAGNFNVEISTGPGGKYKYTVTDNSGKVIKEKDMMGGSEILLTEKITVKGTYTVSVTDGVNVKSIKVVVE